MNGLWTICCNVLEFSFNQSFKHSNRIQYIPACLEIIKEASADLPFHVWLGLWVFSQEMQDVPVVISEILPENQQYDDKAHVLYKLIFFSFPYFHKITYLSTL